VPPAPPATSATPAAAAASNQAALAVQRHLVEAARSRARIAFVGSLVPLAGHARPAALVPLVVEVATRRERPAISGRLLGRDSWCRLRLGADWLVEVWGRGIAVVDGHLVVAVEDDHGPDLAALVVRWEPPQRDAGRDEPPATMPWRDPACPAGSPRRQGLQPSLAAARVVPAGCDGGAGWALVWN
jgi:hypothetical protein